MDKLVMQAGSHATRQLIGYDQLLSDSSMLATLTAVVGCSYDVQVRNTGDLKPLPDREQVRCCGRPVQQVKPASSVRQRWS